MSDDKRNTARQLLEQEVMLSTGHGFRLCQIHDISLVGAKFDFAWPELTSGVEVELTIDLPHGDSVKSFRLPGHVARVATNGTAIEFGDLTDEVRQALESLLDSLKTE